MRGSRWDKHRVHVADRTPAADYNGLKALWGVTVASYAKRQRLPGTAATWAWPVSLSWRFYETDAHRDPDGIASGGKKLIIDALTTCTARCGRACGQHAGVLPTDGHKHVKRSRWEEFYIGFTTERGVVVEGVTVGFYEGEKVVGVLAVPAKLPDFNELRAAVEVGVRRQLRGKS